MKGLLFTYAMSYGGAVVALFNPFIGLLIYVSFAILKPDGLWEYSVAPGNYSRVVFIGLFLGWMFSGFGGWKFGKAKVPCVALVAYVAWCAVSSMGAVDQPLAWGTTEAMLKTVLPVLVGVTMIQSTAQLRQLAWVIVLSQGFLAYEFNLSYYQGFNRLVTVGFAGMDEKSVAVAMVAGGGLALFLGIDARKPWQKALAFLLAALMMHVPLFTFSRGGMLALLFSGAVALWLMPKRPLQIAVMVCAIALGLRLAGPEVRARFSTSFADEGERDASAAGRVQLWGEAWDAILERPLMGVGPRNWGTFSQTALGWSTRKEVHNTWLQTGAEVGLPGLAALSAFYLFTLAPLFPIARRKRTASGGTNDHNIAAMVVCSLVGFFVASQFITLYGLEIPYHVALIGLGLIKVRSNAVQVEETPTPRMPLIAVPVQLPAVSRARTLNGVRP